MVFWTGLGQETSGSSSGSGITFIDSDESQSPLAAPKPKTYAQDMPDAFDTVLERIKETYNLREERDARTRILWAADRFKVANQGRWPSVSELVDFPDLAQTMAALPFSTLPPFFFIDNELYDNDVHTGPAPVATPGAIAGQGQLNPALFEDMDMHELTFLLGQPSPTQVVPTQALKNKITSLTPQQIADEVARNMSQMMRVSGGSGGGGGRSSIVFDSAELEGAVRNQWEGILRETPGEADVSAIVTAYQNEAQAFWMADGGKLDFETFVSNKLQDRDRYSMLYTHKPAGVSEREYMAGFDNTNAAFGLRAARARPQADRAASRGVSLKGFAEKQAASLPVRRQGQGKFSQQFAQTLSGLGGMARS